jgi:tRNA modification GTPase
VSAQKKTGIDELKTLLVNLIRPVMDENTTLLTNLRHFQALKKADESLSRVMEGLRAGLSNDLLTPDLREAIYHIGSITGEITPDDVLGNIFSNFCIGK